MRKAALISLVVGIVVLRAISSWAWECDITLDGPGGVKLNKSITLSAHGTPVGGSYSWSLTPHLTPNGSTAELVGFKPEYSEYIRVISYYRSPKGKTCSAKKYIWVCLCDVAIDDVPGEIYVGDEVVLTALTESQGGTYVWSVNKGSGSITGSSASAIFVADQAGEVEIKVAYTPSDGGEPCKDFYTLQVKDECTVTIAGDSDVAVGSHIQLEATGQPTGGSYEWIYADGLLPMGDEAFFTGNSPGQTSVTVRYTTPQGNVCSNSHTITAFKVENISPKTACFDSGKILNASDFQLLTAPPGYEDRINFMPTTASTMLQSEEVAVTGSCGEGTADDAVTRVTVVNRGVKTNYSLNYTIPDYIKKPLVSLGIADHLNLVTINSYTINRECCINEIAISKSGSTQLILELPSVPIPIVGIPLPASINRYVKAQISIGISGNAKNFLNGRYNGCEKTMIWSGQGIVSAKAALVGGVKAKIPGIFVFGGEARGATNISERIEVVDAIKLKVSTEWGGLIGSVAGIIEMPNFNLKISFEKSKEYFAASDLLPFEVALPYLGDN